MPSLTAAAQATSRRTGASCTVVYGAGLIIETLVELPGDKVPSRVSTDETLIRSGANPGGRKLWQSFSALGEG